MLTSRLAIHVEPLLALISLLYLFHAGPETLLIVQALVVCSGAIPAYLLARHMLRRPWISLVFPLAYLLHPSLQNALLDDFHTVTLSACFLLWAMYFLVRDRPLAFGVAGLLAMATKEEIGLLIAGLGIWWLVRRRIFAGVLSIAAGLGWFLMSVLIVIPSANPSGASPYLSRYAYLGHGLAGVLFSPFRHPSLVLSTLTSEPRLRYLVDLMHPFGFVNLLGLPVVLLGIPAFAINMLSSDARMFSGFYQYSLEIMPYLVVSAILGVAWISKAANQRGTWHSGWIATVLCGLILTASAVDTWKFGFSPLASGYLVPSAGAHQSLENRILQGVPASATVAAADEIEPHLAHRDWIYLLPTVHPRNGPAARYVALDASIPSAPIEPHTLHAVAARLLGSGYGIARAQDGILLLRKGAERKRLPSEFFSFIYTPGSHIKPVSARWGALRLIGVAVHPRLGMVNRSRPAIEIEAYWRITAPVGRNVRISFDMSPVYTGPRPEMSARWGRESDSPTWDWLPLSSWPVARTLRTASLDLVPPSGRSGKVDIAITVSGDGDVRHLQGVERVSGSSTSVRVGSVSVDG